MSDIYKMLNRTTIQKLFVSIIIVLFVFGCIKNNASIPKSRSYQLLELSKNKSNKLKDRAAYIDSAFYISQQMPIDSLALAIISKKGVIHIEKQQQDSFFYYNRFLARQSQEINNKYYKATAVFNLGYYYDKFVNIPDSAFYYYNQAKNNFLIIGDTIRSGEILVNIAALQNLHNNFFGAKESLVEILQYLNKSSNKKYLASTYNELATNNLKLLNYTDAIKYYKKAIAITDTKSDIISYQNNLAFLYIEQGKYNIAINLLQELLLDSLLQKGSTRYARILHNLSYAQWCNGKKEVLPTFLEALSIRKSKKDKLGQVNSYNYLAEYYAAQNPKKASQYLDTMIQLAKKIKNPRAETDALQLLMKLHPKRIAFKDRYIFLKDSLYQLELKVKTKFAKMRYDDQEEKAQILQLQRESAEEKAALATQKAQKILYLSLSGFLLISGVSLYYALRQHYKKEKLKEIYKTEKQISKRLHDELSNDIYGLMASIEQNPNANSPYLLDSLEKIYKHTRTVSHDHREIATGKAFAVELKDTLGAFYNTETTVVVKGLETFEWEKVPDYKCVAIHRSLKEFMVNMKKHSEASLVAIDFKKEGKLLHITYTDNGIGMDAAQKFGVGLNNTVSRIVGVNGKIKFDSENGHGTKIIIIIPY
ncbi:tetratricopeptide repeat-containing sensor histidine kinase [Flavivirga jejuensis]|uniref:histidine kinase n=1 Tax=Flavivirga jejuensis TaxID=870487 RepID=A0ABT8WNR6_9FLAO|nr:tetratricopeptide repeat-containing sensor histidine kinase [Flavivirga jejuensis]MDO5974806.1 tetratricopeptide repeat protein [Flavivirga jejuensis]